MNYQELKYSYIFVGSKIRIEIERKNGPHIEIYNIFCWRMNLSKYRPVGEASAKENYSIIMDLTAQSNLSNKKLFKKQSVYHYVLS